MMDSGGDMDMSIWTMDDKDTSLTISYIVELVDFYAVRVEKRRLVNKISNSNNNRGLCRLLSYLLS